MAESGAALLGDEALAKVNALWELVQESHAEHGPDAEVTRALEAKLADARRDYIGGSGPREVTEAFDSNDERWSDGCVEVEPGWVVNVIDNAPPGWSTIRVNGMSGRVPAGILKRPQAADLHEAPAPASGRGLRRPSVDGLARIVEATESLSAAASVASKSVTGLFSNARRLKGQLSTAVDELTVAATAAAGNRPSLEAPVITGDHETIAQTKLPAALSDPQLTIGEVVPHTHAHSAPPSPASQDDALQPCRIFPASVFLRDIGDIRGQLVFTATQLQFVLLAADDSGISETFEEARKLLWTALPPRVRQSPFRGGDATSELHRLAFAHAHVVYFGIEHPTATAATSVGHNDHDSGSVAQIVAQSGVKSGTVPVPLPTSDHERELEPEPETESSRLHRLHGDLEALGLTPGRRCTDNIDHTEAATRLLSADHQIVAPQIRHVVPDGDGGEIQVRYEIAVC